MNERKTRKLTCIITGRALLATKEYYDRKVLKAGDETALHKTYACKEAKDLLIKGYSVDKIRTMLNINTEELSAVSEETIQGIVSSKSPKFRKTNIFNVSTSLLNLKTDPEVVQLLKNLREEDKSTK